jgi:hypothetical protein
MRIQTEDAEHQARWIEKPLDQCALIQTGVSKGRKMSPETLISVPYLRVANVQDGYPDLSEIKEIHVRPQDVPRYALQSGDVLLTEGGDFDKLGRGFVWNSELPECIHQNHVFAVRVDQSQLDPHFFAYQAQSPHGKQYFLSVAHKTTNLACINTTKLKAFPVRIPPLPEQKEIVHILSTVHRLNAEYIALAEKDMSAFGVQLKDVGGDGAVAVDHHIAGQRIESVLSEGEQRIHALALFFAELETCAQEVIVFDDPISSFDYNHIANYCNRLRDLIRKHPNRQIIVLTHNWEFFVQFQTTINAARPALNHHMAVYVLESCVALDEYREDVEAQKSEIDAILSITGEPSKAQKEIMAGKMRRLIESVVNTHVFNKQRHQFKQKSQQVSAFDDFTRVVPLLPVEAQSLKDLFAKLSITEHDDPRNSYVNTDKAMFRTRYNAIKLIEAAIVWRK